VTELRLATRPSPLALAQARAVAAMLPCPSRLVEVQTRGDRDRSVPLSSIAGDGVFVKEVQAAVLEGRADVAVHSAKDLPASTEGPLSLAAVPPRGDVRDAIVGRALRSLGSGDVVASGSPRRRAQLAALVPGVELAQLRGNIATRLARLGEVAAVVVALVALERLGLCPERASVLDPEVMVPQVGQGALALECRADDRAARKALGSLDHLTSHVALETERAFLATLGSGCDLPAGALATPLGDGRLRLLGVLAASDVPDGPRPAGEEPAVVRAALEGPPGPELGERLAHQLQERLAEQS
jgi:hydroxymethylbilane synthase